MLGLGWDLAQDRETVSLTDADHHDLRGLAGTWDE